MTYSKIAVVGTFVLASPLALAECPVELPYQNLVDCLVTEGAGSEYKISDQLKMEMAISAAEKTSASKSSSEQSDNTTTAKLED